MSNPTLRFNEISKTFPGVKALSNISFDVHSGEALALIGANGAGKSTLMNILGGNIQADSGDILIDGRNAAISSPQRSIKNGIGFVHQEIALMPTMTIAENLFINSYQTNSVGLLDRKQMEEQCKTILKSLNCHFLPRTQVQYLGSGDQQMVEIARALLMKPRILILDEPTSSLTGEEKSRLFDAIAALKNEGVAIIYITHFLDEVFTVCDRAVVLRNGEQVGGDKIVNLTYRDIVTLMIGESDADVYYSRSPHTVSESPILCIKNLSRTGVLQNIQMELHEGEILGLWGLLGSGRTELIRSLVGLDPNETYDIEIRNETELVPLQKRKASKYFGYITENRREDGVLLPSSILENMSLANLRSYLSIGPFVNDGKIKVESQKYIEKLDIKISSVDQAAGTLSGGNQQKVIVGKWLQRAPMILLMDEPTRGLDVGAKRDMHQIINDFVQNGSSILLVTSDIDELMSMSDRITVIDRGSITGVYNKGVSKETLMAAASGYAKGDTE